MLHLLLAFALLLGLGIPIGLVLAGASVGYFLVTDIPLSVIPQRMFSGSDDFVLMAIPLFILAGYLMNETGITSRLVYFAVLLLRRVYGGLSQANILVCMVFGGITGVASAEVAAVGTVLIPAMEEDGYDKEYATAVTMAGSLMGPVIPPSIPLLIYGIMSETSIGRLFLAGVIPGILIGISLMVVNHHLLKASGFRSRSNQRVQPTTREMIRALLGSLAALIMPVIIVGGIVGGVFTPTEAAGISVAYALLVGFLVFRTLRVQRLPGLFVKAGITSGIVMIIVASSSVLNWALARGEIPTLVAGALLGLTNDALVFLLLVIVLLLVIGMPLDPVPALIILTPVLVPTAQQYGIDLIHFGVVMVVTLVIGLLTPPVGGSLFVGSAISRVSVERLSIVVLPFLVVLLGLALLLAFVPSLSLWLPSLLMK